MNYLAESNISTVINTAMDSIKVSIAFTLVFSIIMWIVVAIGRSICIKKAGEKSWKAFIPIYGTYILYKISGMSGYWIIINIISNIISYVGIIISMSMLSELNNIDITSSPYTALEKINELSTKYAIVSGIKNIFQFLFSAGTLALSIVWSIKFCKSFGKSGGYIAGMILVPFVFYYIIGLGDAEYEGNYIPKDKKVYMKI